MKSREQSVALIHEQLNRVTEWGRGGWHYGREELRELMDFIYEGWPENDKELIKDGAEFSSSSD